MRALHEQLCSSNKIIVAEISFKPTFRIFEKDEEFTITEYGSRSFPLTGI